VHFNHLSSEDRHIGAPCYQISEVLEGDAPMVAALVQGQAW
jgi:hypothetical protein